MNYIDIHCHLDSPEFDADRQEVLKRMKEEGVGAIAVGADLEESKKALKIAEANEDVWACIGIHPDKIRDDILPASPLSLQEKWQNIVSDLSELIVSPKVVGVGECGLDYFRLADDGQKALQKKLFESQIEFALKYDKPLMLHIREAYQDALEILGNYKKIYGEKLRGNVHFFAGDVEVARKFLDLGFTMSFTGVITFTHDYDEVVRYLPQNSLMSETDAPWVAPVPWRGKRNEPVYVIEVVKRMAEIRGENQDILNEAIMGNFRRLFGV